MVKTERPETSALSIGSLNLIKLPDWSRLPVEARLRPLSRLFAYSGGTLQQPEQYWLAVICQADDPVELGNRYCTDLLKAQDGQAVGLFQSGTYFSQRKQRDAVRATKKCMAKGNQPDAMKALLRNNAFDYDHISNQSISIHLLPDGWPKDLI